METVKIGRKPEWLRIKVQGDQKANEVYKALDSLALNTVCKEANCPNKMECYNRKTATFMILGNVCTRNCTFCNVTKGRTEEVNPEEPKNIAVAVEKLGLRHVVITTVTRDDLKDGGAAHFAECIKEIRKLNKNVTIEVLISDLRGNWDALKVIVDAKPDVLNHNVETVKSLYKNVRPMAIYERSMELLKRVKEIDSSILTKSGIMVGLGETKEQVFELFGDLVSQGCDILTVGQYLRPSLKHHPVIEYVHPTVFDEYRDKAKEAGIKFVMSGPLVRSSYKADMPFSGEEE
ncbi:lipoyl synthase [Clostridium cylindrosporum]|uniref:Lipoyl synthase n=1 Tax=Clostridium cylindrosporum DSM 605 TaxID=1121307 RepID=A0A0J8D4P8_CLOCY|nr:lipoyl synthase [Clostridium cylindrosporum]KMT21140.1 lipoyl synthase LipA [Clostridium cylindrosporum DSM 605]